jgi:Fe-S-cluster containining protein
VPLSVPEAFRLAEELSAMPASAGRSLIKSSIETARKILDNMLSDFELSGSAEKHHEIQSREISDWYAGLGLPCPFLSDGLCRTYERRPIACREHMVTSPARHCDLTSKNRPDVVEMPVSILECLGRLTAELEQSEVEAVMLPLTLPWVQENLERSRRTWPAVTVVERFIKIIQTTAEACASAPQP